MISLNTFQEERRIYVQKIVFVIMQCIAVPPGIIQYAERIVSIPPILFMP